MVILRVLVNSRRIGSRPCLYHLILRLLLLRRRIRVGSMRRLRDHLLLWGVRVIGRGSIYVDRGVGIVLIILALWWLRLMRMESGVGS
jgi:hypothetical protein